MEPADFTAARREAGHTQASLSSLWQVHRVTIARWESGKVPVPRWAARLVKFEIELKTR